MRPTCPAARPPWPSALSTTTPSASPSPAPPHPPSSDLVTARPDSDCTHSSAPCRPAASPPWPRTAQTPGPTTARNASLRVSTLSSAACRQPDPPAKRARRCRSADRNQPVMSGPGALRTGPGEAAVQCDGGAGDGRPPAPHRGEPGDGEPGDDDDGDEVDDAEQRDAPVARHQQRPAYGHDIQHDDHQPGRDPDAAG